jgi:hypothetical protein
MQENSSRRNIHQRWDKASKNPSANHDTAVKRLNSAKPRERTKEEPIDLGERNVLKAENLGRVVKGDKGARHGTEQATPWCGHGSSDDKSVERK